MGARAKVGRLRAHRNFVIIDLKLATTRLRLMNIYLRHDRSPQSWEDVLQIIAEETDDIPTIAAGDLN